MIEILNESDIKSIKICGKILSSTMDELSKMIKPGLSGVSLDKAAEKSIRRQGARPSFLGYGDKNNPFPSTICLSINNEIVHGIPKSDKIIREGDIVSIDIGAEYKGLFTDMAKTFIAGKHKNLNDIKLLKVTSESLEKAISCSVVGGHIGDIGHAVQSFVESNGFSVVKMLVGHGIGHKPHQDPQVPNFGRSGTGPTLIENMAIAVEPMVNMGGSDVLSDNDGWTVKTFDGSNSCHFEHTILITQDGPKVITR